MLKNLLQCRFDPWVGKIPWRRERYPLQQVFWPGELHGQYSPRGCKELDTNEQFSLHFTLVFVLRMGRFYLFRDNKQ